MAEQVKRPVGITETVLRDAHQSLMATRMTTEQMLPIVEKMDQVGYHSVECWGGATFDASLRFLKEDPWERLRKLRAGFKHTKLQMLFRGQNILGYNHYADDVVEYFVQKSVANGMDIIRIFDCFNDLRNLKTAVNATKAIKKDFLPVLDKDGLFKPVIMVLLEQLVQSGIEEVCLIIGREEQKLYESFFAPMSKENYDKLPEDKQKYEDNLVKIGRMIRYAYQDERRGFGHAVYQSRDFAESEPVLLLLGDMIYESYIGKTCSSQLIDCYEAYGLPVVSMHEVPKEQVVHYGIMHGVWESPKEEQMRLDCIYEKPTVDYAEENLGIRCKNGSKYFAVFGQYILTEDVYKVLEKNIRENNESRGEIQLTDALEEVRATTAA